MKREQLINKLKKYLTVHIPGLHEEFRYNKAWLKMEWVLYHWTFKFTCIIDDCPRFTDEYDFHWDDLLSEICERLSLSPTVEERIWTGK